MRLIMQDRSLQIEPCSTKALIFIPTKIKHEFTQFWEDVLIPIQMLMKDRMLVTSVISSMDGDKREGSSHPNGWAIDVTFPDRSIGFQENLRLDNDLRLLLALATIKLDKFMIAVESDHLHIEFTDILPGVYIYSSLRPQYYLSDRMKQLRTIPDAELITVKPDTIFYDQNTNKLMMKQREFTKRNKRI